MKEDSQKQNVYLDLSDLFLISVMCLVVFSCELDNERKHEKELAEIEVKPSRLDEFMREVFGDEEKNEFKNEECEH